MNAPENEAAEVSSPGSMPALIEDFRIDGLYGYRSISLSSRYAATILIAKNGSGKTTLLAVLDAFLKGQFIRLSHLEFSRITCRLSGIEEDLVLAKEDIESLLDIHTNGEFVSYASKYGIDPDALREFLECDFPTVKKQRGMNDNAIFEKIIAKSGYSYTDAKQTCERLEQLLAGQNKNVDTIKSVLKKKLKDVEVVYLPTYRRIELSIDREENDRPAHSRRRQSIQDRLGIPKRTLFNAEIQFGLSDISDRLSNMNQEILFNSNQGYREISANIINELINGEFEREAPDIESIPEREALKLFFSRIIEGRYRDRFHHKLVIPDIDRIYSGEFISVESNKFLTYFLSKLNTVIKATKDIELLVEDFVSSCNRYLSTRNTAIPTAEQDLNSDDGTFISADEKVLKLDRKNLEVYVESLATRRKIPIDALSSGEKQMISLFSRLYLYPGKKVVLIDEPELSLSLDWQKKILVDVINAPSCMQVIAITHSPFVFDNELEPYAKALSVRIQSDDSSIRSIIDSDTDSDPDSDE